MCTSFIFSTLSCCLHSRQPGLLDNFSQLVLHISCCLSIFLPHGLANDGTFWASKKALFVLPWYVKEHVCVSLFVDIFVILCIQDTWSPHEQQYAPNWKFDVYWDFIVFLVSCFSIFAHFCLLPSSAQLSSQLSFSHFCQAQLSYPVSCLLATFWSYGGVGYEG